MAELSPTNKQIIDELLGDYQSLSIIEKSLFPSKLKTALIHYQDMPNSTTSAFLLCVAFIPMHGLLSEMDFSCLRMFYASELFLASNLLNKANLLTGDSASDNFNAVAGHKDPLSVAQSLSLLSEASLLTGDSASDNRNAVARHRDPSDVAQALSVLRKGNLLTGDSGSDNFNAVVKHQYSWTVAKALLVLSEANLLVGDLASDNRNAVARHPRPWSVARALSVLSAANLLTGDSASYNHNAVATHQDPWAVGQSLALLREANLLASDSASDNFNAVVSHQSTEALYSALGCFVDAEALNQINLTQLIAYTPILLGNEGTRDCWDRIPARALTQQHITAIFDLCRQHQADEANARIVFENYVYREVLLQDLVRDDAIAPVINGAQSTHTASVHQSISQSAINLMLAYETLILGDRLEATIHDISRDLAQLPQDTPHIDVAKRCLQGLIADDYSFTDKTSNVSTKQLLALAWIAIHDETKTKGTLNDAKKLFIEGLYEAQRGTNLSAENVDDGGSDVSICASGTFNKLMEKLCAIHADVEIIFLTHGTAAFKFPVMIKEEGEKYLASLANTNPSSLSECLVAVRIMQQAMGEGAEFIWSEIKDKVGHRIFEEFGSLYRDAKDVRFLELLETGIYFDMSGIPETFQESIVKSDGYREYCSRILMHQGFFASPDRGQMAEVLHGKRNDSNENRRLFDMNFGLIQ